MTGAEALVEALEDAGVACAFGLPGVHNRPAWAALARSPVRLVAGRRAGDGGPGGDRADGLVDDGAHEVLRHDQQSGGDEVFGVELCSPDFVGLAQASGERVGAARMVTTSPRWHRRAR